MDPVVELVRLTAVDPATIGALLNEPRNRRHLPLAGDMDDAAVADWIRGKDAQWDDHGFGPWAILLDGDVAGWGGFQAEPAGADLAVVLRPASWGHGATIARRLLDEGFDGFGFPSVLIALPHTRHADRAVERLGFRPDGEASYGGVVFRQYRLTRERWRLTRATT